MLLIIELMNYPFPIYPLHLLSPYTNFSKYKNEILRLDNFIESLTEEINSDINDENNANNANRIKHLIMFNLGSAGEEVIYYSRTNYAKNYNWMQIHPYFVNDFIKKYIKKNEIKINVIVISPDIYHNEENYKPYFSRIIHNVKIETENNFEFQYEENKINNEYYLNNEENKVKIKIMFFNSFFPNIEKNNNLINIANDFLLKNTSENNSYNLNNFNNSLEDLIFINEFYEKINKLMSFIDYKNKYMIVNNFATFRNIYYNSNKMFSEMNKKCVLNNILYMTWLNREENHYLFCDNLFMEINGKICFNKYFNFTIENEEKLYKNENKQFISFSDLLI